METAWGAIIANTPGVKWVDFCQIATGVYVRYIPASGAWYQWNVGGASWTVISNLTTFLTAGAVTTVNVRIA